MASPIDKVTSYSNIRKYMNMEDEENTKYEALLSYVLQWFNSDNVQALAEHIREEEDFPEDDDDDDYYDDDEDDDDIIEDLDDEDGEVVYNNIVRH